MAFNPFTWFRKHQKVFFAGLTVLCMLVFIGQAGVGADIFQTALRWFGAGKHGQPVVTLYGKKVFQTDLDRVQKRRRLANDFLLLSAAENHPKALDAIDKKVKPSSVGNPLSGLKEIIQNARRRTGLGLLTELFQGGAQSFELRLRFLRLGIERDAFGVSQNGLLDIYNRLADEAKKKDGEIDPEQLEMLTNIATVLNYQYWLTAHPNSLQAFALRRPGFPDFCLGGGVGPDELLDFMVWQHQADRLGITLTDADVVREINREAAGQEVIDPSLKGYEKDKTILDFLRGHGRETARELLDALREEFRVVLAQGLLLGVEPGVRSFRSRLGGTNSPAVGTPDEYFKYFREQRTTLDVKMLPVPVKAFEGKVTEKPSEKELRNRYDRYYEKEPSPTSREPGFKEPRRILVEYLTGGVDDKFYRDRARKETQVWRRYADPASRAAASVGSVLANPLGAPPFARLAVVGSALTFNPLQEEYAKYVKEQPAWVNPESEDLSARQDRAGKIHTGYTYNKYNLVSTLGNLSGAVAGLGGPLAAPATVLLTGAFDEVRGSLKQNLAMLLARSTGPGDSDNHGALVQNPLTAVAVTAALSPRLLPLSHLEPILLAALEDRIAEGALQENINTVQAELLKLKGKDRAAIRAYLKTAGEKYHLKLHAMPRPMSQQAMLEALKAGDDLGIGGLRDAYLGRERALKPEPFLAALFERGGTYDPQQTPGVERREYLYWRAEDHPPRTRPFEVIRAQVEEAWRFAEARKLARKEAERLEDRINKEKMTARAAEEFLGKQGYGKLFELDNVAQLVSPLREVHPGIEPEYRPYRVPEDKSGLLTYPPEDMVKHLLELKRPGQATVVVDQPGKTFYVTILGKRDEPTMKRFLARFTNSLHLDPLYTRFLAAQTEEFHKTVLEQLRREAAGKLDKEGRYDLPEAFRKREGRGEEE
jgi:hypothetical protein